MNTADKRLVKMRQNPKVDWHIDDIKSVARAKGGAKITIPARKPIKPVSVRMFVEFVEKL